MAIILSKNCCDCEGLTDPCAPCETECCMYAARYYESLFNFEDLPDVIIAPNGFPFPKLEEPTFLPFVANPDIYTAFYGFVNPEGGQASGESIGILASDPNQWAQHQDAAAFTRSPCLVDDKLNSSSGWFDDFEDTYTVIGYDAQGGVFYEDAITRTQLCLWENGLQAEGLVFFDEPLGEDFPFGWFYANEEGGGPKSGLQNTPVGEYPIDSGQWEGGKFVISEE